jgi:hypothetical protein
MNTRNRKSDPIIRSDSLLTITLRLDETEFVVVRLDDEQTVIVENYADFEEDGTWELVNGLNVTYDHLPDVMRAIQHAKEFMDQYDHDGRDS